MSVLRRLRQSYASVTATLALFVALGGTSYAALALPRHSVGARELKRGAVAGRELRDGSLQARELATGARPARVRYARVRRSYSGQVSLDGAYGMRLSITRGALVSLELTGDSLDTAEARRACAVSALPVASRLDLDEAGPKQPGGTFLEINNDFNGVIVVYAFDRIGNPALSSFELTLVCPRR